jgi:hypothetical protein
MTVVVSDNFTDVDSTLLVNHIPTLGTSWSAWRFGPTGITAQTIISNQLRIVSPGANENNSGSIISPALTEANHYAQVDYVAKNTTSDISFNLILRATGAAATRNGYVLQCFPNTSRMRVLGYVNNVNTYNSGFVNGITHIFGTYVFQVVGTTLSASIDGVNVLTKTSVHISGAGSVGLGHDSGFFVANCYTLDNFVGGDFLIPPPPPVPTPGAVAFNSGGISGGNKARAGESLLAIYALLKEQGL